MKKLIKFLTGAFLLAALFTSCGNPAAATPEQDDGVTVEQFIEKLIDFNEGITADGQFRITFETDGWMFYKKNSTDWEAGSSVLNGYYKFSKKSNQIYLYEDGFYVFYLNNNTLSITYCNEQVLIDYFNQLNNTLIFTKN